MCAKENSEGLPDKETSPKPGSRAYVGYDMTHDIRNLRQLRTRAPQKQLAAAGFSPDKVMFVAFLELLSSVLFLVPATRCFGILLASSFLGGAIATHLQHAQSIVLPSIVLLLIWLGTWLRHPEVLWSRQQSHSAEQATDSPRQVGERA
jgi:DoxX-like family